MKNRAVDMSSAVGAVLFMVVFLAGLTTASITDGLEAYWPLEGDLTDASGNGRDATPFGAGPVFSEGVSGMGADLGIGVDTGTWNPSEATGSLTVSCWIKWRSGGSSAWQGFIGKRDDWGAGTYWCIDMNVPGGTSPTGFGFQNNGGGWTGFGGSVVVADEWTFVCATIDEGATATYWNGARVSTGTITLPPEYEAARMVFGCAQNGGGNPWTGMMDEVAIWNRALDPEEIAGLYNNGVGNPINKPVATVTESSGATIVMENGPSDSFAIELVSQPSADVTVTIDPRGAGANAGDIRLNDAEPGQPLVVGFSAGNWDVAQTITVSAVADEIAESRETIELVLTSQSFDADFDDGVIPSVLVTVIDSSEQVCPTGDLDGDCDVDFDDMMIFAEQWTTFPDCDQSQLFCADLNPKKGVDYSDFAVLAENWKTMVGPLIINEFLASNGLGLEDEDDNSSDWIEIRNISYVDLRLDEFYLTDDPGDLTKWKFPDGLVLNAGGYLLVFASGKDKGSAGDELHTSFELDADGEYLAIVADEGRTIIYEYNSYQYDDGLYGYPPQKTDISYGLEDLDSKRYFAVPSPLEENDGAFLEFVDELKFSHQHGFYDTAFNLTITCSTEGASIRYTLDGSEPDESANGFDYNGPIGINSTTCVRAAAFKPGWQRSDIKTASFLFDVSDSIKSLPVISIVGDEENSLYEPYGIMAIVGGYYSGGAWRSDGPDSWNNPIHRGMEYERPVSVELINAYGDSGFQIDCGIRVAGSDYHRPRYTRGDNWRYNYDKFSFKLFFRNAYGDNRLEYPIFPLADTDRFEAIMVRGGHNDIYNPFIKDELVRRLHKDMGGVAVVGTMWNLFINGEYKAFFNPCERLDHDFFKDYFDSNAEWDVITQRTVRNGDSKAWDAMISFFRNNDLSIEANYLQAGQMLDIEDFIDYLIVEIYSANWDWPANNWTAARERTAGAKFRFHCWDMEGSMETGYLNSFAFDDFPSWAGSPKGLNSMNTSIAWLYRALKANEDFRMHFSDRIQEHFFYDGALIGANITNRFNELRQLMSGALPGMNTSILTQWIPSRHGIMLNKFADENLFSGEGPEFLMNGSTQHGGYVDPGDELTIVGGSEGPGNYAALVGKGSVWRYYDKGVDLERAWRETGFDDTGWESGRAELGYGENEVTTVDYGPNPNDKYVTTYFRLHFDRDDTLVYKSLKLDVQRDDGAVVYLNGVELGRSNMPGVVGDDSIFYDTNASEVVGGGAETTFYDIPVNDSAFNLLTKENNVLAVEIHQQGAAGQPVTSGDMSFDLQFRAEVEEGVVLSSIWYTMDGSDPRMPGGAILPSAQNYQSPLILSESTQVKARTCDDGVWSAIHDATYGVGPVAESLRVTEIMYHVSDPNEEFVELMNIGTEPVNLNLVRFSKGVDFVFPSMWLGAGEYVVVVRNQAAFEARYGTGLNVAGEFAGALDNSGERITLIDAAGSVIHDFRYKDGWYDITDGAGFSLTIRDAAADLIMWGEKDGWRASALVGGSPGSDDSGVTYGLDAIVLNEVLAHSDGTADWIELHNTTQNTIPIGGWWLSDDGSDPAKYVIDQAASIPAGGYIVFTQDQFGNIDDEGCVTPFALSENGERLYLQSAQGGVITGAYSYDKDFGASERNVTLGRYYMTSTQTDNFVALQSPTKDNANAAPKVDPIVISEIMYHPMTNADAEYIELLNISGFDVTLYDSTANINRGWQVEGISDFEILYNGQPLTMTPGERVLLVKSKAAFWTEFNEAPGTRMIEWTRGSLSNGGESIRLSMPGDYDQYDVLHYILVDRVRYSDGSHPEDFLEIGFDPWPTEADGGDRSLDRIVDGDYGNDPDNWQAGTETPGW